MGIKKLSSWKQLFNFFLLLLSCWKGHLLESNLLNWLNRPVTEFGEMLQIFLLFKLPYIDRESSSADILFMLQLISISSDFPNKMKRGWWVVTHLVSPWPVKVWGTPSDAVFHQCHGPSSPVAKCASRRQTVLEQILWREVWGRGGRGL